MIAHSQMYLKVSFQQNLHVNFFKHEKQAWETRRKWMREH